MNSVDQLTFLLHCKMKGSLLWQPGLGHFLEVSGGIDLDDILTRGLSGKRGTGTRRTVSAY